jgi:hypothetical protein
VSDVLIDADGAFESRLKTVRFVSTGNRAAFRLSKAGPWVVESISTADGKVWFLLYLSAIVPAFLFRRTTIDQSLTWRRSSRLADQRFTSIPMDRY